MPFNPSAPNAAAYGVFSPTYAAKLAQGSGNPGADVLNNLALMMLSRQERGSYSDDLRYVNDMAAKAAEAENQADIARAYLPTIAPQAEAGVSSSVTVDNPYVKVNRPGLEAADVVNLDATASGATKNQSEVIKNLAQADVRPTLEYIAGMIANPLQTTPADVENYTTYENLTDRMKAEASQTSAKASMVRANKGVGDSGGGVTISYTPSPYGIPTAPTIKGTNINAVMDAVNQFNNTQGNAGGGTVVPTDNRRVAVINGVTMRKNAKGEWEPISKPKK